MPGPSDLGREVTLYQSRQAMLDSDGQPITLPDGTIGNIVEILMGHRLRVKLKITEAIVTVFSGSWGFSQPDEDMIPYLRSERLKKRKRK